MAFDNVVYPFNAKKKVVITTQNVVFDNEALKIDANNPVVITTQNVVFYNFLKEQRLL